MFTNLSDIVKIPLAVLAGILVSVLFYEGLRLPWIGQIIPGIIYYRVDAATESMVTKFERDVLASQLAEERRLRLIADQARTEANNRAAASARLATEARSALDRRIEEDTGPEGSVWTEEDMKWQRR
jgi:hypothetical protein